MVAVAGAEGVFHLAVVVVVIVVAVFFSCSYVAVSKPASVNRPLSDGTVR